MGYRKIHKGYICLDLLTLKFLNSHHVLFYDQEFPFMIDSKLSVSDKDSASDISPFTFFYPLFINPIPIQLPNKTNLYHHPSYLIQLKHLNHTYPYLPLQHIRPPLHNHIHHRLPYPDLNKNRYPLIQPHPDYH